MVSLVFVTQLVVVLAVSRLADVAIGHANSQWALSRGAVEDDRDHYRVLIGLWVAGYAGTLVEVWVLDPPFLAVIGVPMIAMALLAEAARWWTITTLGPAWTNRVIRWADDPVEQVRASREGPFRYTTRPAELTGLVVGVALPLAYSAWVTALVFAVVYATIVRRRMAAEAHEGSGGSGAGTVEGADAHPAGGRPR